MGTFFAMMAIGGNMPFLRVVVSVALLAFLAAMSGCAGRMAADSSNQPTMLSSTEFRDQIDRKLERKLKAPKRFDQPKEAQEFFVAKRAPLGESVLPTEPYLQAISAADKLPAISVPTARRPPSRSERLARSSAAQGRDMGAWTYRGPGNIGGRTRGLIIDPNTPSTLYASGVAGGIWKSVDSGASWAPQNDLLSNLAVNSLAISPHDSQTLYAGTGEGFFNYDYVRGLGVFKTTDGGANWSHLANTGSSDFHYVNKLIVSPTDANTVYAATRTGVWRSVNGGTDWSRVLDTQSTYPHSSGCLDLVARDDQPGDTLFAACGNTFDFQDGAIYRSANGGDSWTQVYTETDMGRASLAIAPSNQDYVYALIASQGSGDYNAGLLAVVRSTTGGGAGSFADRVRNTSGTKLHTMQLTNPVYAFYDSCFGGGQDYWYNQGWYDNVIAVDPADENIVWTGGIDLMRSDDGGASWGLASYWWASSSSYAYNHADQHVIVFDPGYDGSTNQTMYTGNDGGLHRTDNARGDLQTNPCGVALLPLNRVAWTTLNNGYGVTQFYHGTVYPGGLSYFGGTQDNGSILGEQGDNNGWSSLNGGDGGYTAIDPTNTDVLYVATTRASFKKSTNGGASFSSAINGIGGDAGFDFIAPYAMAPSNPEHLWAGGYYAWRTTDGMDNWTQASDRLPGSGSLTAVAIDPDDADHVLIGMSDGYIAWNDAALSADSATSWPSSRPASGRISSIAFDPRRPGNVYATCSTFGQPHVLRSTDGGQSFADITNDLPDIPTHSVAVHPRDSRMLFVGTDIGVFVSTNSGDSWLRSNDQFANVITEHLAVDATSDTLFAFTHGRGVYSVSLPPPGVTMLPMLPSLLLQQ